MECQLLERRRPDCRLAGGQGAVNRRIMGERGLKARGGVLLDKEMNLRGRQDWMLQRAWHWAGVGKNGDEGCGEGSQPPATTHGESEKLARCTVCTTCTMVLCL